MITDENGEREKDDFYPTPRCATDALLERETFLQHVWEPACGDGAISKVLKENGYTVFSSDLVDRGYEHGMIGSIDFLSETDQYVPATLDPFDIITNPPFKFAQEFIEKALSYERCNRVAIFAIKGVCI